MTLRKIKIFQSINKNVSFGTRVKNQFRLVQRVLFIIRHQTSKRNDSKFDK